MNALHAMSTRAISGALLPLVLAALPARAQERLTEHVLALDPGAAPPPATIADAAWIAGHWQGEAIGGWNEEVWAPPVAGAMMGMFRHVRDGRTGFYEIMTLVEEHGSLVLRLKHFNPDLSGWEEKAESVEFRLVRLEPDALYFDGITFRRIAPDEIHVHVATRDPDSPPRELVFPYRRATPANRTMPATANANAPANVTAHAPATVNVIPTANGTAPATVHAPANANANAPAPVNVHVHVPVPVPVHVPGLPGYANCSEPCGLDHQILGLYPGLPTTCWVVTERTGYVRLHGPGLHGVSILGVSSPLAYVAVPEESHGPRSHHGWRRHGVG